MTMPEERSIDFKLNEFGSKTVKYGLKEKLPVLR
jgi:hypothetical protein